MRPAEMAWNEGRLAHESRKAVMVLYVTLG